MYIGQELVVDDNNVRFPYLLKATKGKWLKSLNKLHVAAAALCTLQWSRNRKFIGGGGRNNHSNNYNS